MSGFTCECGRQYEFRQVGAFSEMTTRKERQHRARVVRKAKRTQYQRYNLEAEGIMPQAPDVMPGEEVEYKTPVRAQNVESDVVVPALQSLMFGAAAAICSTPLVWVKWDFPVKGIYHQILPLPWHTPLVVFALVAGGSVFVTSKTARKLLMRVEKWTGQDIDGDGQVGTVPRPPIPVEHIRDKDGKAHRQYADIPFPRAREQQLANWFYLICRSEGDGFSIRIAKQYGISPAEVGTVQTWFLTQQPPQATRAKNNWIRPTVEGLETMWGVVTRNIPGATLPPDRV